MTTLKSTTLISLLVVFAACGASQSTTSSGPAPAHGMTADQLATLVQQEGKVYNMVAPLVKAYTMNDFKTQTMTKEQVAPRRKKLIGWGTRLKRLGADIDAVFPELNDVQHGVDTPSAKLVQQETAVYNMVAPLLKTYTMNDFKANKLTKEQVAPRRKKLVGWGGRLKSLGGPVDAVFPELK